MDIRLSPCSKCGDSSLVSMDLLCRIWKRGYDSMNDRQRKRAKVKTDVTCHCGNKEVYDTPMFKYMFQLIFEELVKQK